MFSPSFRAEGIALCSAFMLEAVLIVSGNLLTIVLFALEKTLRKKSLLFGCQYGVRRYDVRSCIRAFVYLPKYRFSLSAVEHRL